MFLFWNWFPRTSCYDRYCFYCGGFVTSISLSLYRKPSFGFGIFNSILTFRGCSVIISFYFYLLLRFLGRIYKHEFIVNLSLFSSNPPKPHGFVTIPLQSTVVPKINTKCIVAEKKDIKPIVIPRFMVPKKISTFNMNNVISKPTPISSAKSVLPKVGTHKFTYWVKGSNIETYCVLDSNYLKWLEKRSNILKSKANTVSAQLPESSDACIEAFLIVVGYLVIKYPHVYKKKKINKEWYVLNKINNKLYPFNSKRPLENLALLTMDDFSIIQKRRDGDYYLTATATLFPIGWSIHERIGFSIVKLHNNAPYWQPGDPLFHNSDKIFDLVKDGIIYQRNNFFIVNTPDLYLPINHVEKPTNFIKGSKGYRYQDIHVRREQQTAIRLPKSQTILFGVRSFIRPITSLTDNQLLNLYRKYLSISRKHADYHKVPTLAPIILEYIVDKRKLKI